MSFLLFVLMNAALFLRPGEWIPPLAGLPIYEALIVLCLLTSLPRVTEQLRSDQLALRPITASVIGLLFAVVLSRLSHLQLGLTADAGISFVKIVIYYLLFVANVSTFDRLRRFLSWITLFIVFMTALTVLQYHGKVDIAGIAPLKEWQGTYDGFGEPEFSLRLRSVGIFNDPNDFCLILLLGAGVSLYRMTNSERGPSARFLWIVPIVLCMYAVSLTHSRGGFLALLAGMVAYFVARFGSRKAIPLAVIALPVMLVLFAGRQTRISSSEGTGQDRIRLWSEGLALLREAPLFGIGKDQYAEEAGLVAHNSYLHSFVELGFFGGTLFCGMFLIAFWSLNAVDRQKDDLDPEIVRMRPYIMAIFVGYSTLLLTISRNYVVPTYLIFGLVTSYVRCAGEWSLEPPAIVWNRKLVRSLVTSSVGFIAVIYLFVRVTARWSS